MKIIGLFILGAFAFITQSCLKDKTVPIDPNACGVIISYSLDIQPIINTSCVTNQGPGTGCHDGWIFNYDNIPPYMQSGLWQEDVLNLKNMPQFPLASDFGIDSLTADELQIMKCWIDQGYPNN